MNPLYQLIRHASFCFLAFDDSPPLSVTGRLRRPCLHLPSASAAPQPPLPLYCHSRKAHCQGQSLPFASCGLTPALVPSTPPNAVLPSNRIYSSAACSAALAQSQVDCQSQSRSCSQFHCLPRSTLVAPAHRQSRTAHSVSKKCAITSKVRHSLSSRPQDLKGPKPMAYSLEPFTIPAATNLSPKLEYLHLMLIHTTSSWSPGLGLLYVHPAALPFERIGLERIRACNKLSYRLYVDCGLGILMLLS